MYDLRCVDGRTVVDAASGLLAADVDGPAAMDLASMVVTPLTSPFELDALVALARDELGMPVLDGDRTAIRAAQAQLRRWRDGELTDRQLASWAHTVVGHDGPAVLHDLVVTDDVLDELKYVAATPESVHDDLEGIALRLLAYADPWDG
jgi:hypothetical protein